MSQVPEFWLESAKQQISTLQAEVARLTEERDYLAHQHNERVAVAEQQCDALKRENEALRLACKLARSFVEACDWPAHDPNNDPPPFRVQRKEALKALDAVK